MRGIILFITILLCLSFDLKTNTIKSVFIVKLNYHIKWSKTIGKRFVIAVSGNKEIYNHIKEFLPERFKGREASVLFINNLKVIEEIPEVDVVYIGKENRMKFTKPNIVTFSDYKSNQPIFLFYFERNKLKFDVNLKHAKSQGIAVNARVLTLANKIYR